MNAHTTDISATIARRQLHVRQARALEIAARRYAVAVEAQAGRHTDGTEFARFELCNAIIDLIDDGDARADRENIMCDLNIDEQGDPLRPEGCEFEPSLVHPDDGCQSKGFRA